MTRGTARHSAALLSAGLAFALLPTAGASAAPIAQDGAPAPTAKAARAAYTVTLVTGDKVTVTDIGGGTQTVDVKRPLGVDGLVRTQITGGRITVTPDEARPYLASGKLDQRLFDVTGLLEQGLVDTEVDATPLIVTYRGRAARTAAAVPRGAERTRRLVSIGGAALDADKGRTFWNNLTTKAGFSDGIGKVWLDGRVKADMEQSNAQIGTPKAWEAGLTGKGVKVAVLDTGYDISHPDLASRVIESKSFIAGQEVADRAGHGTHVTSTVGGSGAASDGKEKGVAPDATLAVGKVLSNEGYGEESQIIAGMEWAAKDVKAKIVSMSLGSDTGSDGTDPMAVAVNSLSRETGALFVIAAGNAYSPGTIGSPGAADSALTVGAVDARDKRAAFSSQGPRLGDNALKPDVSAPGVDILAARSSLVEGSGSYTTMSGTSMATPHVAGMAALLAQQHPDWTGQQLKDALMSSSKELDASAYAIGAGRVSVPDAIAAQVTATGSVDLGMYAWPYEDNKPVTRTLTYSNSSGTPVELDLAVQGGATGLATIGTSRLTVPAHGSASTTVTGDGSRGAVGNNSGQIVATSGATRVAHTAFGLVKEEERYTLTVHVKGRDGMPTAARLSYVQLVTGARPDAAAVDDSGTVQLRLKPGTYYLDSFLDVPGAHGKDSLGLGYLADPEIKLDGDREVTLDGGRLREIATRVTKDTEPHQTLIQYDRNVGGADAFGMVLMPIKYDTLLAAPTHKVEDGTYAFRTTWREGMPQVATKGVEETWHQPGSTLVEGRTRLAMVNAGSGTPTDYAGKQAKDKAALVHVDGTLTPAQIAQAAQDAGVKALFLTDDNPGRLNVSFFNEDGTDRPLQITSVNAADYTRLLTMQRQGKRVEMTGTPRGELGYVYDLSKGYQGVIPDRSLIFAPRSNQLATVDTTYYGSKKAEGSEFRYSVDPAFKAAGGFQEYHTFPGHRTDYVSVEAGQQWHESVNLGENLEERSGRVTYPAGRRTRLEWFKPVWRPYGGSGLGWGQQRRGNALRFNIPGWGDSGPDHTGFGAPYSSTSGMTQYTEAWVDGESTGRKVGSTAQFGVTDSSELPFKVATDTALDPKVWGIGTTAHSEWTFKSAATPTDAYSFLPLINLNYDLDTDIAGAVRAGARLPIGLSAEYVEGATGAGTLGGGALQVSYDDGKTWKSVQLRGSSTGWKGTLNIPRHAISVSLKAGAKDNKGGSVAQEIIQAVTVR
ncbi:MULTISPECIES: S8 family serine peptidase [unclassified Streptomyces]|uniref:S8 family serine peptidase n=1 Tax=Streptomyces sp. NPDC127532 TaxID=3345399 RepID=UPI00363A46CD